MQISKRVVEVLKSLKREIQTSCSTCKGVGCPTCAEKFLPHVKMAKAAIPVKFYSLELDDYTKCTLAKAKVTKYINKIDEAYKRGIGLYFYGASGLGKSFLQAVVIKSALRKGYSALCTTLSQILTMFGDSFYDKGARDEYQREVLQVQFLAIDDIDKTYISEKSTYALAAFDQVIRTRSNELLPTIISSNKPREELFTQDSTFYSSSVSLLSEHLLDVMFSGKVDARVFEISPQITKEFFGGTK